MKGIRSLGLARCLPVWGGWLLLFFAMMPGVAEASRRTISTLPFTASLNNDTIDLAGTKLTSIGSGILVTGDNVVINLGSDTLVFGTAGTNSVYGIAVEDASNVKVNGGLILKTVATGSNVQGIDVHNSNNVTVTGTNITVTGHNVHCVNVDGGLSSSYLLDFNGGVWTSNSESYTSRENYDGAVFTSGSMPASAGAFDIRIRNVVFAKGPGQGIILRGRSFVQNCSIQMDAYNKYWDTVHAWGQAPIGQSWANPYAILARGLEAGAEISGNVITSGNQRYGSRGILMELCGGTRTDPITVFNNVLDLREGPNKEGGNQNGILQVFRIRGDGDSNIYVHDNQFIGSVDNNAATTSVGREVRVFYMSAPFSGNSNIIVRNNLIRAVTMTSGTDVTAMALEGTADPTIQFQYNRIESAGEIVRVGGLQGPGRNFLLQNDTISYTSTALNNRITFTVGHYNDSCTNNRARDCVYLLGARDTNIRFENSSLDNTFKLERSVTIKALGFNALPVPNATVTVTNNYGKVVLTSNTGSRGEVVASVPYWFESEDRLDSLNYNPIRIKIKVGNDSSQTTLSLTSTSSSTSTLTLASTAGQPVSGNAAPTLPVHLLPANGVSLTSTPVRVTVRNSTDANNDPVRYDFWVSGNSTFTNVLDSVKNLPSGFLETQATFSSFTPAVGQTYWWRCRATDGIDYTATTAASTFTFQCSNPTVADLSRLTQYLFGGRALNGRGDYNGDSKITTTDLTFLVNFLFGNGPAPSCG